MILTYYAEFEGTLYRIDMGSDGIFDLFAGREWAGKGRWTEQLIEGCAADLPEGAYEALEEALSPSDDTLRALQQSAGKMGDSEQVALCRAALSGDEDARDACALALSEAVASRDDY